RGVPFLLLVLAGMALVGWPMLRFGMGWMSFGNIDLANYCVGATRFVNQAWEDPVEVNDVADGTNTPQAFWCAYVRGAIRAGGDLLLAWQAALTGRATIDAAMPILVALHGTLIASAGFLVWRGPRGRYAALMACGLVAASALTAYSTLNQLLGQSI